MSLISSLLEGYNNGGSEKGTPINCTPTEYINSSIIDLVTESYEIIEAYNTANLIGMGKVLTEGLDPSAVYESVFDDFIRDLSTKLATFANKFDRWKNFIVKIADKKISVLSDSFLVSRVNAALSGRDADERLNWLVFPYRTYTTEEGLKQTERYLDELNKSYYDCVNFIISVTSGTLQKNAQFEEVEAYRLDKIKQKLSSSLSCEPSEVLSKILSSFGGTTVNMEKTFTICDIKDILSDTDRLKNCVDSQISEIHSMLAILTETTSQFSNISLDDNTPVNGDVLAVVTSSMLYILNLEINALKTAINCIFMEMDQNRNILTTFVSTYNCGSDCPIAESYDLSNNPYEDAVVEGVILGAAVLGIILTCVTLTKKDQIDLKKAIKIYETNEHPKVKLSSLSASVYQLDKANRPTDIKLTGIKKFFNKNSRRAKVWESSSGEYICSNVLYTKVTDVNPGIGIGTDGDVIPGIGIGTDGDVIPIITVNTTTAKTTTYRLYDVAKKYKKDSEYLCAAMSLADGVSNDNTIRFTEDIKKKYPKEFKDTKVKFFGKSLEGADYTDEECIVDG